jgi:hypothetical protein
MPGSVTELREGGSLVGKCGTGLLSMDTGTQSSSWKPLTCTVGKVEPEELTPLFLFYHALTLVLLHVPTLLEA